MPEILIVSSDHDLLQLINKHAKVIVLKKGISETVIYDEVAMQEKYGFPPKAFIDFKALKGDASDNILGVKGIGEKTAQELIQKFGNIEKIYDNAPSTDDSQSISPRIKMLLEKSKDDAFLSKKLTTIICDVPMEFNTETCLFKGFDKNIIKKLFTNLGFKTLINRV